VDAGLAQNVIGADTVIGNLRRLQRGRPGHQWHTARRIV
jgi:hypothetical protein